MSVPARAHSRAVLPAEFREALRVRIDGDLGLPLLPDTAARVLATCQNERADLDDLADLIAHDQSLATHILRVANSAGYAPRVPILSIQQAIGRVGFATVGDIAVAVALRERVFYVPGHQQRIRELWRHSAATACYAKEIAHVMRRDMESAFLCGLLHDVGMPMVMQLVCDLERDKVVPSVTEPLMEAAMHEFHAQLGARMADAWQLGPWIRLVILHHHEPARAKFHPEEIPVVALADALADWASDGTQTEDDYSPDRPVYDALRMHEGALHSLLAKRARVLESVEAFA